MNTFIATPHTIRDFFIAHGQRMHYEKRQAFVRADDPQPWVYFLEEGAVEARDRAIRGDEAGARADWERAVELAPDSATADLAMQNLALSEAGPQRR